MKTGFRRNTSWQKVAPWYNKITEGGRGHYFHRHVVIPGVLRLLGLNSKNAVNGSSINILDLACGNGVLAKHLQKSTKYTGVDLSEKLIKYARNDDKNTNHEYVIADVTKPLDNKIAHIPYSHAVIILALQNIQDPKALFLNASKALKANSKLLIVINHPMFRIPRQSSWGFDEARKIQYRRVDRYLSPMTIPIKATPSDPNSQTTLSYHYPLSTYAKYLSDSGFVIENIEEWTSDKESVGKAGKMENRARNEFPLFMAILSVKL